MVDSKRDTTLTVFAVLFAILAVSNLLKPFQLVGDQTGFVFFGTRLTGTANAIAGPLFGIYLLTYTAGIWNMKRYALPMAVAYAVYVVLNLVLFPIFTPSPDTAGYMLFSVVYAVIAIGVSAGAAVALSRRKADLS